MSNVQSIEFAAVEVQPQVAFKRLGRAVVVVAIMSFIVAFLPSSAMGGVALAAISLLAGLNCLIRDPGYNGTALLGIFLASAAVSVSTIMAFVQV